MDLRMNRNCTYARLLFPESLLMELTNAYKQVCIFYENAKEKEEHIKM